jgi:hypothetical protein
MSAIAERVYTDQDDIRRLKATVETMPDEAIVEVTLVDGNRIVGTVVSRPSLQTFVDPHGQEGTNGHVRIDVRDTGQSMYVWLDRIEHVVTLGSD